jgi:hypothetical protein
VRFEPDPMTGRNRWVPDRTARQAIVQLGNTLEEHLTAERGAKADTEAVLALLTATGLGLGGGVASKVVLAVASAASVGVAALDVANLQLSKAESEFAAAAVQVIGEDRLVTRNARVDLSPTPYLTLALSLVGLKFDFNDMAKAIQLSAARRATERSLADIAEHGFTRLGRLPVKEQALASALMDEAASLRAAGKPLTPAQRIALRAADKIEAQFAVQHPWNGAIVETKVTLHPPPDDFRSATTEPDLRSAVTEANPPTNPSIVSAPDGSTPVTLPGMPPRPPGPPAPGRYMDVSLIPAGMPLPGTELRDPASGRMFRVGQPYGAGAYATTYDLLDDTGRPTGRVVKFLRQPFDGESKLAARLRNAEAAGRGTTPVPWDDTPLPELIDRLAHGQRLLDDAKIPYLKMAPMEESLAAAGRNGHPPFIVQDVIPDDAVRKTANLEPGQKEAVAVLYKRLADANLVWLDGHLGNVYFKRTGNAWEAGILDPDMLVKFAEPIASPFLRNRIGQIFALPKRAGINSLDARPEMLAQEFGGDIAQRMCRSAHEFMARMFEHKRLVRYQSLEGTEAAAAGAAFKFEGLIDAEIVARIFGRLDQYVPAR